MKSYTLKYFGSDCDLVSSFTEFLKEKSNQKKIAFSLEAIDFKATSNFVDLTINPIPSLILIDFTEPSTHIQTLLTNLSLMKNHEGFRPIPFVGIFKDREQLTKLKMIFNYGIVYSFIKGHDVKLLLEDCFYLAFDEYNKTNQFALAKFNGLKYTPYMQGVISQINSEAVLVDTDFPVSEDTLDVTIPWVKSESSVFQIDQKTEAAFSSDSSFNYKLLIPYPGVWDTPCDTDIQKEQIETYIENHSSFFAKEKPLVLISNEDLELSSKIIQNRKNYPFNLCIQNKTGIADKVAATKPDLIILNDSESESLPIADIISKIKDCESSDYDPIIFIFNTKTSSAEIKILYDYDHIIAYSNYLSYELIKNLLVVYSAKPKHFNRNRIGEEQAYTFKATDSDRLVKISCPIYITSLTEHEMTFFCTEELPMFSNLFLNIPINFTALIIPNQRVLANHEKKGKHYTAILHGIEMQDTNLLRKFINFAIYQPLETYDLVLFNKEKSTAVQTPITQDEEIKVDLPVVKAVINDLPKRRQIKGKSKL